MPEHDPVRRATIAETGESLYSVSIHVAGHHMKGDEPVSSGGSNLGPSPYDFLLTSLGECTVMTVRWYALQQKWPLDKVEVKLTHHKENKVDMFTKQIILTGDSLTDEQRIKLVAVAARCPVQRTLEGAPVITTTAT